MSIPVDKIREVIGTGGKVIQGIVAETGAKIDIEEDGRVFIAILPGKDGLIHISKLAKGRVNKVTDVVKEGDMVKVEVIEIDDKGRINLRRIVED